MEILTQFPLSSLRRSKSDRLLESKQEVFEADVTESRKLLKLAKDAHEFIESKRAEIINLTGNAAPAKFVVPVSAGWANSQSLRHTAQQ